MSAFGFAAAYWHDCTLPQTCYNYDSHCMSNNGAKKEIALTHRCSGLVQTG